jgi:hypothetical protein
MLVLDFLVIVTPLVRIEIRTYPAVMFSFGRRHKPYYR